MVFIIVSVSSLSFASRGHESMLSKKYTTSYSKFLDEHLSRDQQEKIFSIRKVYKSRIAEAVKEVREITNYLRFIGESEGSTTNSYDHDAYPLYDPVLTDTLKTVVWERRAWLSNQRKAFEDEVKKVVPGISYLVLKALI